MISQRQPIRISLAQVGLGMALPLVLVALLAVEAAIGANAASLSPPRLGVDQLEAEVAAAAMSLSSAIQDQVPTILTALLSDYRFTLTVDPISVVVGTHQCMYTITSGTHWRRGGVGDSPVGFLGLDASLGAGLLVPGWCPVMYQPPPPQVDANENCTLAETKSVVDFVRMR